MWRWGVISYLLAYFVVDYIIKINSVRALDVIISMIMVIYFAWHIYALRKCAPKKPKLTTSEKKEIRQQRKKELPKKLLRKLFLKEPMTKWNPITVATVIDVFSLAIFLGHVGK